MNAEPQLAKLDVRGPIQPGRTFGKEQIRASGWHVRRAVVMKCTRRALLVGEGAVVLVNCPDNRAYAHVEQAQDSGEQA